MHIIAGFYTDSITATNLPVGIKVLVLKVSKATEYQQRNCKIIYQYTYSYWLYLKQHTE